MEMQKFERGKQIEKELYDLKEERGQLQSRLDYDAKFDQDKLHIMLNVGGFSSIYISNTALPFSKQELIEICIASLDNAIKQLEKEFDTL